MARKMTEWPSKRGPITKIMPSDGCIGDTVPLAVGKWYDFHEFGWYMGNVGIDDGATKILVDFEDLNYISSSGLRMLLAAVKRLEDASGQLRICSPNKMVQEVFDTSGFSGIFSVYKSQAEALDGF